MVSALPANNAFEVEGMEAAKSLAISGILIIPIGVGGGSSRNGCYFSVKAF